MLETKKPPTLETERLVLLPWRLEYADDMLLFASNENVITAAEWKLVDNIKKAQKKIQGYLDKKSNEWAIALKENGENKIIGTIGMHRNIFNNYRAIGIQAISSNEDKLMIDFGYLIAEEYWGKGIATEASKKIINYAFIESKCDVMTVWHRVSNHRSKRVIEKCNFKLRGIFPKHSPDAPNSKACYFLMRDDYLNLYNIEELL
ncbi:MAG: GNAT family N-acetyltransferase [Defluviitaleaceae bacterium]|nr:GNAT family N-acetyltransferase [Defluviitaleaceae bacterium]